jgi:hypothetical protein
MNKVEKCQLCGFEGPLQKHHLIPQRTCRNKYKNAKDDPGNHAYICDMCHRTIHAYFTENELRDSLHSIDSLKSNERFSAYLKWRSKHMDYNSNSTKMSRSRK